jgi:hypothetical protein
LTLRGKNYAEHRLRNQNGLALGINDYAARLWVNVGAKSFNWGDAQLKLFALAKNG